MSRGGGGGRSGRGHKSGSRTGRGRNLSRAVRDNRSRQLNPRDHTYWQSRAQSGGSGGQSKGGSSKSNSNWREWMDEEASKRIQSHADKTGRNQDFKGRAQRAAKRNEEQD
ncbi:MAG: Uncharacterised protein [Marine Group II euryarchaeote MED-G33]|nr:MAG: Uncharacterised protein [Marine Group II euryarchaeote MED-G33]